MSLTDTRFRNLCSFWTKNPETPRCVALNDYYEPQYNMWSRCNIVIPLMNWEGVAFFRPCTFSKDQLEHLNFLITVIAPKADIVEVGTYNLEGSTRTVLYVRNRFDGNTFWLNNRPATPRKENAK